MTLNEKNETKPEAFCIEKRQVTRTYLNTFLNDK